MRIASGSLILTISFLQAACNTGGGESDTAGSTTQNITTFPMTTGATDTDATPTSSTTEEPTSSGTMSGTSTTGDESTTGTTGNVVDTTTNDPQTTTTVDPSVSSSTGAPPCDEIKATLMPVAPNIMLVLDKSGSMVANPAGFWDHDADPNTAKITRWNSLYDVVKLVVSDYNETINFGANLFPSTMAKQMYDATACPVNANVEIPVAPMNKDAILNGIPAPGDTTLKGGTPAAAGVAAALTHLKTLPADVPRAMILVTDGAANCATGVQPPALFENYDMTLHTLVEQAFTVDNIPTYVVGIDTKNVVSDNSQDGNPNATNTFEKLNDVAVKGGKPKDDPNEKFYNAVNQIQLKAALDAIAADAISCTIPLTSEPGFPQSTKVFVGDMEYKMVTDCATEDGWVYDNPMGPYGAVILCGAACEALKIEKAADVEYYCTAN